MLTPTQNGGFAIGFKSNDSIENKKYIEIRHFDGNGN